MFEPQSRKAALAILSHFFLPIVRGHRGTRLRRGILPLASALNLNRHFYPSHQSITGVKSYHWM